MLHNRKRWSLEPAAAASHGKRVSRQPGPASESAADHHGGRNHREGSAVFMWLLVALTTTRGSSGVGNVTPEPGAHRAYKGARMALLVEALRSLADSGAMHDGGGLLAIEILLAVVCGGGLLTLFLSFHLNRWK
jgi:hypothetical protein